MAQHSFLKPLSRVDLASAARTSSSVSATLNLPQGSAYEWILDVTAQSGTADSRLDVAIKFSPDNGTTFYATGPTFPPVVNGEGAIVHVVRVQPSQGAAEAGATWVASSVGGPIAQNVIMTPKYQIAYTIAGTTGPSFTFKVWLLVQPKGI